MEIEARLGSTVIIQAKLSMSRAPPHIVQELFQARNEDPDFDPNEHFHDALRRPHEEGRADACWIVLFCAVQPTLQRTLTLDEEELQHTPGFVQDLFFTSVPNGIDGCLINLAPQAFGINANEIARVQTIFGKQ